jgi:hypothetical protein
MNDNNSQRSHPKRRSARIILRIPLLINAAEDSAAKEWERVKTVVVSAHGAMIRTAQGFDVGTTLDIRMQDTNRSARAKVVWTSSKITPEGIELGFEILDQEGFWEINFLPDDASE